MQNSYEPTSGPRLTSEHLDSDEERAFRLRARDYMAGRLPPRVPGEPANAFENIALVDRDRAIQRQLWDGHLAGITVPKEYGGLGLDKRHEDIFCEEAEPYRLAWHFGNAFNITLPVLLKHGTEEQKKRHIPAMLKGDVMWCQLLSEPSGGSDLAGLLTRAEKRGDKWILNGSKIWTSGGHVSDMGLCLARTDPTVRKHAGLTVFLVDMHAPGMTVNQIKLVGGNSDFCQEFIDDVEVSDDERVGAVNDGWTVAQTQLDAERAGMAAGWHLGLRPAAMAEHIQLSQRYPEMAREAGRADDPLARQCVGEALVIDAVYTLVSKRIAAGRRNGQLPPTAGMLSSLLVARTAVRRSELLSTLAGPAGVALPRGANQGSGDRSIGMARVTTHRIGGGTQEMQRNLVAERHLGLPREPGDDRTLPFNQVRSNAPK
jgi:alkylation response protein AidB-like acyl-CoA dehydrogenase